MSSQKDHIAGIVEKYPELADRGITENTPITDVLDEVSKLLEERDERLNARQEKLVLLSAQVPVSLKKKVQKMSKYTGTPMKRIISDSLYEYMSRNPQLLPQEENESTQEDKNNTQDNKETSKK